MALIIEGKMPKDCLECRDSTLSVPNCPLRKHTQGNWYRMGSRHPYCPIIDEIPDEHGDLIDQYALANSIPEAEPHGFENCAKCTCMTKDEMVEIIMDAEVVLERTK